MKMCGPNLKVGFRSFNAVYDGAVVEQVVIYEALSLAARFIKYVMRHLVEKVLVLRRPSF